jgi:TonB family protein
MNRAPGRPGWLWAAGFTLAAPVLLSACGSPEEVEDPVPLYGEIPIEYPLELWDLDVEGETLLRVRVTELGEVDSVEVIETSGYPAFDSAALRGARQLRYTPARRGERRVSVWAKVPVHFSKVDR